MTSGRFPYLTLLGRTVDTCCWPVYVVVGFVSVYSAILVLNCACYASVYGTFVYVNMWITDPEVDSRLSGTRFTAPCI